LLNEVCKIIVDIGYAMAWIGYAERDMDKSVRPVASAGNAKDFLEQVRVTWCDDEQGRGPAGTAIRTGQACVVQRIETDVRSAPWRKEAAELGFESVCSLPLVVDGQPQGALVIYSREPESFDDAELILLRELVSDVAFGIGVLRARQEHLRSEAAARKNEQRFQKLVENSNDMIAATNKGGQLTVIRGPVKRLLGYEADELVGQSVFSLIHAEEAPLARNAILEQLSVPNSMHQAEYRFRSKTGDYVALEVAASNLLHDEVVKSVVLNIHDISARKHAERERTRLQEQLQQAMKMEAVGRLAGGIAHDFNNILTVIAGNIDLARLGLSPADPLTELLDEVAQAGRNAAALTRQLLVFSRRQIVQPLVVNLNDLVENVQKMLSRVIGEDIALHVKLKTELDSVRVDPGQFEQVLLNLSINARDAMPSGGELIIETANVELDDVYCQTRPYVQPGPFVLLAVSDTGHGMTEEVKLRLFEPFFTTKPRGKGTGLGLATIFGTVKQAGGSIEVYSELNRGSTFKIFLPRVEGRAQRLLSMVPARDVPLGTETILLVEDEDSVRELGQRVLKRLGYRVIPAASGDEAYALVEKLGTRIDLVMTDVVMPGQNGRELVDRIQAIYPEIRVLYTSGYTEDVIVHHGVLEQELNFVGKPYSLPTLARKLREVLRPK
jgi:PAS domain S-box-containing protein